MPDGKVGHDAFAVIRETIREMNKVAIGRVVLTNREHSRAPRILESRPLPATASMAHPRIVRGAGLFSVISIEDLSSEMNFRTIELFQLDLFELQIAG